MPTPTECSRDSLAFASVDGRRVEAAFDGGAITSDAGALLFGAVDQVINLVERFAACFTDGRDPERIERSVATRVGQRVFGWRRRRVPAVLQAAASLSTRGAGGARRESDKCTVQCVAAARGRAE